MAGQKFLQKVLVVFLAVLLNGVYASPLFALNNKYLDMFSQNDILFYDPDEVLRGGKGCYSGNLSGDTIMAKVVSYLKGNNPTGFVLSDNGIAGILASFEAESGFNPFRFQNDSMSGPAYGIAQFDPMSKITSKLMSDNRTSNYFNQYFDLKYTSYNGETGLPTESVPMEVVDAWLSVQLDFFFGSSSEFENTEVGDYRNVGGSMGLSYISDNMSAHEAMDAAQSPEDAARIFVWIMERPADKEGDANSRSGNAQKWLNYVKATSGGSGKGSNNDTPNSSGVTIIGDSLVASSSGKIKEALPQADIYAQNGKKISDAINDVQTLINKKQLQDTVIFALGTDDNVSESQVNDLIKLIGDSRKIVFVTDYSPTNDYIGNNNIFVKAKNNNSNVFVADWKDAVESKTSDYFDGDGADPNVAGQELLANVLAGTVGKAENTGEICVGGGSVEGGLTEDQAQRLADYYNSGEIDPYDWGFYEGTKNNCTAFSQFFVQRFTSKGKGWGTWGNGKDVAHDVASLAGLPEGTGARPFALFSVTQGVSWCGAYKCGHTGIVVAVNGNDVTTVEAAWGVSGGAYVAHHDLSYFVNTQYGDSFTYLDNILNQSDLAQIVGN